MIRTRAIVASLGATCCITCCDLTIAPADSQAQVQVLEGHDDHGIRFLPLLQTTELEARLISFRRRPFKGLIVLVDGSSMSLDDDGIEQSTLPMRIMIEMHKPLVKRGLMFHVIFATDDHIERMDAVAVALERLGRDFGLEDIRVNLAQESSSWMQLLEEATTKLTGVVRSTEPALHHNDITAYEVGTSVSRHYAGHGNIVVFINRPFDRKNKTLSPQLRQEIGVVVARMRPSVRNRLFVGFSSVGLERTEMENLVAEIQNLSSTLGFSIATIEQRLP